MDPRERVLLVGVSLKGKSRARANEASFASRDSLQELEELTLSAGGNIVATQMQVRDALDPPPRWSGVASWRRSATRPKRWTRRW